MKNIKLKLRSAGATLLVLAMAAVAVSSTGSETTLVFPHDLHVEGMGIECMMCHEGVAESTTGKDNLMPPMDICGECHDIEDEDNCEMCHSDMENLDVFQRVEDYSPPFNHKVHVEQELDCEHCHPGVETSQNAQELHLPGQEACPGMDMCMNCHDGLQAAKDCMTCHQESNNLLPADHASALWVRQHGDDVKLDDGESCVMCHERNSCMECHEGDNLFFGKRAHQPGYEFKHPLDVRSGRVECAACHESTSFCAECHHEENVYPRSHQRGLWASRNGGGGRHAIEARINLEQCASCHGEETEADPVCATCHGE